MTRDVLAALVVGDKALDEKVLSVVALEVNKDLGVKGAVRAAGDLDDLAREAGADVSKRSSAASVLSLTAYTSPLTREPLPEMSSR